ncbi:MAG TPA: hypothetical protein VKM72_33575 [Thermoanaerobaculia bacterium]|nr:hypothetical protein [Thermoanaerobaculia bacterium]
MNMLRRNRQHRLLLALAITAVALASVPQANATESALDAAKGGKGGGNGHGGGGGGKPGASLSAELQPDVWNTNYDHSEGTVSAVIRGDGLGDVNLDSIVLVGTDDAEEPVAALRATRQGKQIRAFFAKDDAIASLDTPTRGEVHEVTIQFTVGEDDTEKNLTDKVRIVGEDGGGDDDGEEEVDLDLAIQADHWNVNWKNNSNGTVSALIRGEGLEDIDLDSIELVGTDPDAEPLEALRATRTGNHVRAFFAKDDAFATLDTPKPGEQHEITITLIVAGEDQELTDKIRVVGPNR